MLCSSVAGSFLYGKYFSSDSSSNLFSLSQWDGAVRMWEHRQTHPLEEERERERDGLTAGDKV